MRSSSSPNVLVIMTDQERYPPPYETAEVAAYRRTHMPARERLRETSVELHRHYTGATACVPSRATLFTGQYPSLHGAANTDGLAKSATDPGVSWLDADSVPTLGDWFRAAGYRTHYRGKWHLSHPDLLVPGTHSALMTNDTAGTVLDHAVDLYRRTDRLDGFGFSGWIGREPHGAHPADTGFVRDGLFADQVCDLFAQLSHARDAGPWCTVASFVNPHDIVFSGLGWQVLGFPPPPDDVPDVPEAPSQADGFEGRPRCQEQFRDTWTAMLYEQPTDVGYRRFYHWLHALVDVAIARVLDALDASGMADDTIVVLTADHGEMLGAHGGLQQKWHNAFDETIRVPCLVSGPGIEPADISIPTSHVDLLPTLLGLCGIEPDEALEQVGRHHTEAHPLVGRDLSAVVTGSIDAAEADAPVYFMTEDQISEGLRQVNIIDHVPFDAVERPAKVEAVITHLPTGDGGAPELWKLARTYDRLHSDPEEDGSEWELHHLTVDPEERTNLASGAPHAPVAELRAVLGAARERVRLVPRHRTPTQ